MNIEETPHFILHRWEHGQFRLVKEYLGDESLVHLCLNGEKITTLLASKHDLEELICGHFHTEYSLDLPSKKPAITISEDSGGVRVDLLDGSLNLISKRSRPVVSSCGACDQDELSELVDSTPIVAPPSEYYSMDELVKHLEKMKSQQTEFSKTGGVHGAGLLFSDGTFVVMEDIGRHNAVDKVIGATYLKGMNQQVRALFLSGRCGWDIVAKAAKSNIPVIVSVGAASSLAAQTARAANITLVTFVRNGKSVIIGAVDGRFHTKD
ncbi:formate dehydrogenase accessory sulfurtransferase FdhD [Candidatus Poseidonia alphae]|nr:formate dehydrogenase accessory sulfurtransferase FdhD [Candidatus Poseidonia alphae]